MADEQEKVNQFALPHGLTGRLAGRLMAVVNADMERAAVSALDLEGDERVLEVGFGPGVGIRLLSGRLPRGAVEGIDPSGVMLTQAVRRNRKAVAQGRVELRLGTSAHLPWPDGRFDAVVSVNNVQEWPSLGSDLAEVRRVLEEHGQPREDLAVLLGIDPGRGTMKHRGRREIAERHAEPALIELVAGGAAERRGLQKELSTDRDESGQAPGRFQRATRRRSASTNRW